MMLLDDEPIIIEGLAKTVDWQGNGFTLSATARNGVEGLEIFEREQPDAVITDIRMRQMDGLQFIRKLRERGYDTEIAVLTAFDVFDYAKTACSLGVTEFILKPINDEDLEKALSHMLENLKRKAKEKDTVESARKLRSLLNELVSEPGETSKNPIVRAAVEYTRAHISETSLSLMIVAKECSVSADYLGKLFKKHMHIAYNQYLNRERIKLACRLLLDERFSVGDVASAVGYESQSYFQLNFKKETGMTPRGYRIQK
ncbi:MAG: response regulator transcription factor [Christensenellales bacterium]|jgi:two-component system response regulator YesN